MNEDDVWAAIDSQRRRTADLLEELSDDEWRHPSLCRGWTVRDVAAHLTLQQLGLGAALRSVITHPSTLGGVNRMIRTSARIKADQPTERLIAEIRSMIGSRRHNVGVTSLETLTDILVHGQDIAIPLHRELAMPTDAAAVVATGLGAARHANGARFPHRSPPGFSVHRHRRALVSRTGPRDSGADRRCPAVADRPARGVAAAQWRRGGKPAQAVAARLS